MSGRAPAVRGVAGLLGGQSGFGPLQSTTRGFGAVRANDSLKTINETLKRNHEELIRVNMDIADAMRGDLQPVRI